LIPTDWSSSTKTRLADLALGATACENALRPAGTLETAYLNNRRDAIENLVDADPAAARMPEIMVPWLGIGLAGQRIRVHLTGRLRWAQTFLCTLEIDIVFGRDGRVGTRTTG
jgi:hypothetical protein